MSTLTSKLTYTKALGTNYMNTLTYTLLNYTKV